MRHCGDLPRLAEPTDVHARLDAPDLRIVDLSAPAHFADAHIPGAINLPYADIVRDDPPVLGLLPAPGSLQLLRARLGLDGDTRVVALDAEGGAAAGRLLWTLECIGHPHCSLLDGGLRAWHAAGLPLTRDPAPEPDRRRVQCRIDGHVIADRSYILEHLEDPDFRLLDARSIGEYDGSTRRAARAGHIPGARHYEWTRGIDPATARMRPAAELLAELEELGITPQHEVCTYCHTHHRSGFSYWMLRVLGFTRVRAYPGSWSDWGNRDDVPVESGA